MSKIQSKIPAHKRTNISQNNNNNNSIHREVDRVDKLKSLIQKKDPKITTNISANHRHNFRPNSLLKQYQQTVPSKVQEQKSPGIKIRSSKTNNNSISTGSALKKILEETNQIFKSVASTSNFFELSPKPEKVIRQKSRSQTPQRREFAQIRQRPNSAQGGLISQFKKYQKRQSGNQNEFLTSGRISVNENQNNYSTKRKSAAVQLKIGKQIDKKIEPTQQIRKKLNDTFRSIEVDTVEINSFTSEGILMPSSGKMTKKFLLDDKENIKHYRAPLKQIKTQTNNYSNQLNFEKFIHEFISNNIVSKKIGQKSKQLQHTGQVKSQKYSKFIATAQAVQALLKQTLQN